MKSTKEQRDMMESVCAEWFSGELMAKYPPKMMQSSGYLDSTPRLLIKPRQADAGTEIRLTTKLNITYAAAIQFSREQFMQYMVLYLNQLLNEFVMQHGMPFSVHFKAEPTSGRYLREYQEFAAYYIVLDIS